MRRSDHLHAHAGVWFATCAPATAVALIPHLAERMRAALAFPLTPTQGTPAEAVDIALTNARLVTALILAAVAAHVLRSLGKALDVLVGAVVVANAALVGVAAGAYGARSLPWLLHPPLEWTALGATFGVYIGARRDCLQRRALGRAAGLIAAALVAASLAETYLTPQR